MTKCKAPGSSSKQIISYLNSAMTLLYVIFTIQRLLVSARGVSSISESKILILNKLNFLLKAFLITLILTWEFIIY